MTDDTLISPNKVGLYIHIPFCRSKCPYCDFISYVGKEPLMDEYVSCIIREASYYHGIKADTVFIGGGTPSCLPRGFIIKMMEGIRKHIDITDDAEFTIEANPNSFLPDTACEYRDAGCTRLSLGLQSASDRLLKRIGRIHTKDDFSRAFSNAVNAGISNINADIMYSLPGETESDIYDTLGFLDNYPLTHISAYSLIIEEGTPFYDDLQSGRITAADDEHDRSTFKIISEHLRKKGLSRYEISNFSVPGMECAHNLKYWRRKEYIGLGVSAYSFLNEERFGNCSSLEEYIRDISEGKAAVSYRDDRVDPLFEELMLGTRLTEGIRKSLISDRGILDSLERSGLIHVTDDRIILTEKGMDIQDSIVISLSDHLEKSVI